MKKILGFTDDDIEENDKMLDVEAEKQAVREYWTDKISEYGSREAAEKAIAKEKEQDSEDFQNNNKKKERKAPIYLGAFFI